MKHRHIGFAGLVGVLAAISVAAQPPRDQPVPRRIAVFGSSVANGTGDENGGEGYAGRLRNILAPRGWAVLNQSRGGDDTRTLMSRFAPEGAPDPNTRYLLPVDPSYVLIGLSLGNEGIAAGSTPQAKETIATQFASGLRALIARSREHHIVPIVTLCYTRNDFTALDYDYTRRMNLLINSWDVPSVNFLGAVDDGTGKWTPGFWWDALHPNASGHTELATTFVPTLFEALEQGKPIPTPSTPPGFTRLTGDAEVLTFSPDTLMHPFAVAVTARAETDGTLVSVTGATLTATTTSTTTARGAAGPSLTTLTSAAPFTATIGVRGGVWTYTPANGAAIASSVRADAQWHQVVLSHYTARGETLFYVDGRLAGKTSERLEPKHFALAGSTKPAIKNLLIYRSALNGDEVTSLSQGTILQASLDIFAPLADGGVENRAQSLSMLSVYAGGIVHVEK